MSQKITIPGIQILQQDTLISEYNQIEKTISMDTQRGKKNNIQLEIRDDDIIALEFQDNGEWIGSAQDIYEIFGPETKHSRGDLSIHFPTHIQPSTAERGITDIAIKIFKLIRGKVQKELSAVVSKKLGQKADHFFVNNPGLFRVTKTGDLIPFDLKKQGANQYLLYIHGTLSSFKSSFEGLYLRDNSTTLETIIDQYGDQVLALEHHTVSVNPFQNAVDLMKSLPAGCTLDIISHSRGGLVADILACCDHRNNEPGYADSYFTLAQKEGDPALAETLKELNRLVRSKKLEINKVVRVACPANGTLLLSSRLDHFLNGLLHTIGLAVGDKTNPIYQFIRGFITDIISTRTVPEVLPGLLAMVPDSLPQRIINRPFVTVSNQLMVIEGDAEFGRNVWHSIKVVLSNLFYREANDFVVNTRSMRFGALRDNGLYTFSSQTNSTSHFNYFKNKNTRQALLDALSAPPGQPVKGFEHLAEGKDRGAVLDLFVKLSRIRQEDITGQKPIVILLPGIMGTHLSVKDEIIWADLGEIGKGKMYDLLHAGNTDVGTQYIIGNFYSKLVDRLELKFDVYTMGYDWRLSLALAAEKLKEKLIEFQNLFNQPIILLAHSMGGLVVRDLMRHHPQVWKNYIDRSGSRAILLGTPWLGSHLIMQVLTGHFSKVKQLSLFDTHHSRKEMLAIFHQYPGLYELLPINDEPFEQQSFWKKIKDELKHEKFELPPLLSDFSKYKKEIKSFTQNQDLKGLYYLAGKSDLTINAYQIEKSIFGSRLQYYGTSEGDGSVTWDLGIPAGLNPEQVYYADQTTHGQLANDPGLFEGIMELIDQGTTQRISNTRPSTILSREVVTINKQTGLIPLRPRAVNNRINEDIHFMGGIDLSDKPIRRTENPIEVVVVHGDLRISQYPVMVGHFKNDGITNAEAAIDRYYGGKLSERSRVGRYPGSVGESLILFDPANNPKGAVIIGLGEVTDLTPYHLRKSVEAAVLNYAMHFRDNLNNDWISSDKRMDSSYETSLSCLCIGTGYGRLPMEEALNAILTGVQKANELIQTLQNLKPIRFIEFIELYEHIAQHAYYKLSLIENRTNNNISIHLTKRIETKPGAKRKFQFATENSWWHHFTTQLQRKNEKDPLPSLHFTSASGIARVEEDNTFTAHHIIESLLNQLSAEKIWNAEYSKTLFEILVPNAFKEIIRHQNNILWKMDIETAAYPWEMFHDHEFDTIPTFVRSGLIRQLYTRNNRVQNEIIKSKTALVIGDPDYGDSGLIQLPFARLEATAVNDLLQAAQFESKALLFSGSLAILNQLYNQEYKILHIAAHGNISDQMHETGIALGDNIFITPAMLNNLSRLPEFVFINCCWSGAIIPGKERYFKERYRFAANIGTQLIEMGVHAVVIAGWPVDDIAAGVFAQVLYSGLLEGRAFGDAVLLARQACWDHSGHQNNTWGAYQCYGDQWYRLVDSIKGSSQEQDYFTPEQVYTDLYNVKSMTKGIDEKEETVKELYDKLNGIIKKAKQAGLYQGTINEKEADILAELNLLDEALERYEALRKINRAEFSVQAIEQVSNLRIKSLLAKAKNQLDKAGLNNLSREMKLIRKDFDNLIIIGKTPERYSLLGSAYKKLAWIRDRHRFEPGSRLPAIETYLIEAEKNYQQAYLLSQRNFERESVYPLANWLILHATLSGSKTIKIGMLESDILRLISQGEKALNKGGRKYVDFWEDIGLASLLETKLFYTLSLKELDRLKIQITDTFKNIWNLSGTPRHLHAQEDQLDFMMLCVRHKKADKKWKDKMEKILSEMKVKIVSELK